MNFAKCCQGMYDAVLFACGALRYFVVSQIILPLRIVFQGCKDLFYLRAEGFTYSLYGSLHCHYLISLRTRPRGSGSKIKNI